MKNLPVIWITLFAIAMGFMESAVVVYLRTIYYPLGFNFPLKILENRIAITELFREACTMVMLLTVSLIAVRRASLRFAMFIYMFAIWDIFYYIFLFLLLSWPSSFFTWDILFLIPVTWTGPVLAPLLNSLTMIIIAVLIIISVEKNSDFKIRKADWLLLIAGSLITIVAYTSPYLSFILDRYSLSDIFLNKTIEFREYSLSFIPSSFSWFLLLSGEMLFLISGIRIVLQIKKGGRAY